MKRILMLAAAAALAASCCFHFTLINKPVRGNGVICEKQSELPAFNEIKVLGAMDVEYTQCDSQSVLLRTDENLQDIYVIDVLEDELHVSNEKGVSPLPSKGSRLFVSNPGIRSVKISGSGDCVIPDELNTDGDFTFSLSGSGDLEAKSIICNDFTAKISGSGDIDVDALTADNIVVTINGSGDASIGLKDAGDVTVRINGSGDVTLYGNARTLSHKVNGSGNVNSRQLALSGE